MRAKISQSFSQPTRLSLLVAAAVAGLSACGGNANIAGDDAAVRSIDTVVVIYA